MSGHISVLFFCALYQMSSHVDCVLWKFSIVYIRCHFQGCQLCGEIAKPLPVTISLNHFYYFFKLFLPCIFSTYGIKTNWCHCFNFIRILQDLYMFRAHRHIFRRVRRPVGPKHVEIRQYTNKIETVTSVGFYSIFLFLTFLLCLIENFGLKKIV